MSNFKGRRMPLGGGLVLALLSAIILALPVTSSGQVPIAAVSVCQVTGSANAPSYAQVQVAADQVAAYLSQFPGSFVGSCPAAGGSGGSGGGGGGGGGGTPPVNAAVTVCQVTGSANALNYVEVQVAVDQVAAYINRFPGSFAGSCPAPGGGGAGGGGGSGGSGNPVPSGAVTVCRVTGSVNAPNLVQVALNVDQVVAFLNQNPGSFIGTCPGQGGAVTQGPGRILGIPLGAGVTICQVTSNAGALRLVSVDVAIDRVAAFLNQNPGSFVGLCPSASDPNGTLGNEPLGYVTICRVTGNANNPLAPVTIRTEQLAAYLTQAGTIVPGPTGGCPDSRTTPGGGSGGGNSPSATEPGASGTQTAPSTAQPGQTSTIVVRTTPNTVVTARGAGVKAATKSNKQGKAKLVLKPKRKGIITIRADRGRIVQRIGVAPARRSGANLTG